MITYNELQNEFDVVPADETTGIIELTEELLTVEDTDIILGTEMWNEAIARSYDNYNSRKGEFACGDSHSKLTSAERQLCRDVA